MFSLGLSLGGQAGGEGATWFFRTDGQHCLEHAAPPLECAAINLSCGMCFHGILSLRVGMLSNRTPTDAEVGAGDPY